MTGEQRFFLLTRARDNTTFIASSNHIQRIIPADLGSHICWSNDDEMTQVIESVDEILTRIKYADGIARHRAMHCVNNMPEAIKSFRVLIRKIEELITSDGFGDEISSFDLRRLKEYCEETLDRIDYGDIKNENT